MPARGYEFYLGVFVYVIIWLRVQFENKLHEWVFQKVSKFHEPVGRMQFELFDKHTIANYFQIEREKSCDYLLIIYIPKLHIKASSVSEMTHAYHVMNKFISLANHNSNYKLYTSLTLNSCQKTVKCLLLSKSGKNVCKCHSESLSRKA